MAREDPRPTDLYGSMTKFFKRLISLSFSQKVSRIHIYVATVSL